MKLSSEQQQFIIQRLGERGILHPCPMCKNPDFNLYDELLTVPKSGHLPRIGLAPPSVHVAVIYCDNCGFMSQHLLPILVSFDELDEVG